MIKVLLLFKKTLDHELASLNYQLANTNETGQEVVRHLQDTAQDPTIVIVKVDEINDQWEQLQAKLLVLKDRVVEVKVSPERSFFTFHVSPFKLHASRLMLYASHLSLHALFLHCSHSTLCIFTLHCTHSREEIL